MEGKALLEAIGQMMDSKLVAALEAERVHTSQMMDSVKKDMSQMMDEKLAESERRVINQFKAIIETDVTHKITLLAEGHGDVVKKLRGLDTLAEKVDDIQDTVDVLKHITVKK